MSHLFKTGIAAAAFSVASLAANAADTTFTISSWAPPTHGMNAIMFPELTKAMQKLLQLQVGAPTTNSLRG